MNSDLMGLVWFVVLLASNAFFVGAEFAVISAKRAQIEPKAKAGNPAAKITLRAMEKVSLMLATAQLGITVSSLLILVLAEPAIHHLLEIPLGALGLGEATTAVTAFTIALILVTYLHVVLGEMLPKNIAISIPTQASLVLTPALYAVAQLVKPLVWVLNQVSNLILIICGFKPRDEANTAFTLEQVEEIVSASQKEGTLADGSGAIVKTFEFTEKTVADVAVPLDKLVAMNLSSTPGHLQAAVAEHGFSRYPVTSPGSPDQSDILGYWHIKDGLTNDPQVMAMPLSSKKLRAMISIPETTELEDALAQMRKSGAHIVRSFSSSGKVVGCLFLEDIIEELVGEIEDATTR
ncbi:MAG: HlyC/CorC family transporter [Micrococcales bacterium]|jgi:CBS domain containing-hemolysin-like protein|nr:HlyC/CorC family transporter [Micrococcales bacterium]MBT5398393.1 HlyC/CorC family transporter [Micrococcales bacterium]MBT5431608.1 HlyC/CorC family transporter [Micrococcales bacterium]MBT5847647.1 HlyC/CorC family transporter [Micrococcales bacterium]MBT7926250.1 HlyC/CorC family transporter [Micrococcales bacterium]